MFQTELRNDINKSVSWHTIMAEDCSVVDTEKIRRTQQKVIHCYNKTPFVVFDGFSLYLFCLHNGMTSLKLQCKFPSSWNDNLIAGIDWLQGFMKRHKNLTLRKSENTSLFRAAAFNKTNLIEFFDNYKRALKFWKFTADRVYNIDETGVSTVVQSHNIFVQIRTK
jgi:hypothetical protein